MAGSNEIWLKVKGWFEDRISNQVHSSLGKVTAATQNVSKAMKGLAGVFGGLGAESSKTMGAITSLVRGFQALGPAGAVLAGINVALGWITDRLVRAAEAAKELAQDRLAAMQRRLAAIRADEIEKLDRQISKAADDAARAASAFDAMANAYLKVARAKDETAAAGDAAELAKMGREKQEAMAGASTADEAALIGAGHDILIAQAKLAETENRHAEAIERATKQAEDDARRAADAEKAERDAKRALAEAKKKAKEAENLEEVDPDFLRMRKRQLRTAEKNAADATNRRIAAQAQEEASAEALKAAELRRAAALDEASASVAQAQQTESDLAIRQMKAAQAEYAKLQLEAERKAAKDRQEAERRATEARNQEADAIRRSIAEQDKSRSFFESELTKATQDLANAWHLYRDKSAMQAVMDEEKAQKEAERSWERDFRSLRSRRRDWRTSEKLNVDERAVREVALAKERKEQSERALVEIAENTRQTKERLESLLTMKGGD